jgi:hypothetical protein
MRVPRGGGAGRELNDAGHGLLDHLTLALEIVTLDLGQLRPCLRLHQRNVRDGRGRDCKAR